MFAALSISHGQLIKSLLFWTLAVAIPCLPALSASPLSAPVQEDSAAKFKAQFADALRISDAEQMAQIVKRYQNDAVDRVERLCTQISEGNSDELEQEVSHAL